MDIASTALIESDAVTSVYDLLRQRCGLSQADAASFHGTRIDTIKSWCSDRRTAPAGVLDELRDLYADISEAGDELTDVVKLMPQRDANGIFFQVGAPLDNKDAIACGFPCEGSCLAAVALAIASLPGPARIVPRVRGAIPTAVSQKKSQNSRVTVYHFKVFDTVNDRYIVPSRKSPMERIKMIGGEPLMETAERIQPSALDRFGRYEASDPVVPTAAFSPRAREVIRRYGLETWVSAKPSNLRIDGIPRIAFTFQDGKEVHFEAGICRRLSMELDSIGETEAARVFEMILKQML
ncbi:MULTISPECIES: hypothetical protein [unclassified Bradyrhizobium]|uniref:helix-turn-helix domain-containing protein n=1 Tax=unclassified Bradyrhizobium TaxID=2631580 RepID=UPI0028EF8BFA|nr:MULTISPECIES: hypothetical protein [unclassified Bradyrhizobium]